MKNFKSCSLARVTATLMLCLFFIIRPAVAQNVKITPLGSHDGEFCKFDRALILEDPNGTRILYDAGRTVAGGDDSRLGKVDVGLVMIKSDFFVIIEFGIDNMGVQIH